MSVFASVCVPKVNRARQGSSLLVGWLGGSLANSRISPVPTPPQNTHSQDVGSRSWFELRAGLHAMNVT